MRPSHRTTLLACLLALTGVIWITQALRDIDLMTSRGQTVLVFLGIHLYLVVKIGITPLPKKLGIKEGATVDVPTVPWFWDSDVRIALAPGATCFEANKAQGTGPNGSRIDFVMASPTLEPQAAQALRSAVSRSGRAATAWRSG